MRKYVAGITFANRATTIADIKGISSDNTKMTRTVAENLKSFSCGIGVPLLGQHKMPSPRKWMALIKQGRCTKASPCLPGS